MPREGQASVTLNKKVYELAELGMDRVTISRQSNVPIGEVNLILDLWKTRPGNKPN